MHIFQVQNCTNLNQQNINKTPNFKAVTEVYHFLREKGKEKIYPACSLKLNETLQSKLIRILNNSIKFSQTEKGKNFKNLVSFYDSDYEACERKEKARSYYDYNGGWIKGKFKPINYLITGKDVKTFVEKYAKPIGKSKGDSPKIDGKPISAEYQIKINNYIHEGLNFVKDKTKHLYSNKKHLGLFTVFDIIRDKKGKIINYELSYLAYRPTEGESNPFVKLKYYK